MAFPTDEEVDKAIETLRVHAEKFLRGPLPPTPISPAMSPESFQKELADAYEALTVLGTGKLKSPPLVHEGPRSYAPANDVATVWIEMPSEFFKAMADEWPEEVGEEE